MIQLQLIEYADFYKKVYELPPDERPSDDVIEDDVELDRYLADLTRKRAEAYLKR